jgi:NAD(P)-dependent dehydrogenase (short-subunit alcohol dehydrogenase family)
MQNPSTKFDALKDLSGKTCLVTGATSGIGKVTAMALAAQGAQVVITGRSPEKLDETRQEMIAATGNEQIHTLCADFSELDQVRAMAGAYKERFTRLDVLVNNAGGFFNARRMTPYGVEMSFLVNHLAPFLLTNLLLETIIASAPARIVNVSSEAHRYDKMDFDDLGFKRGYVGIKGYARSKLANVLFTYELSRRLEGKNVTVNAVHPGEVATNIWKTNFGFIGPALKWVMGFFYLTPEEGAATSIYAASSQDVEGITGKYFSKKEAVPSSPLSYDKEVARKLWEISEQLTDFKP